jgi:Lon protease-like protein
MPMFPLGTVLFPGMPLPLHVFEPRYRALTRDVLAGDHEFGVVLIERGSEVGGGDQRFDVGAVARVVEAAETPDGRWALLAVGVRRLRVRQWLPDDPYPRAEVVELDDGPVGEGYGDALAGAARSVRKGQALLSELEAVPAPGPAFELVDDPLLAGWQLAAMAPLGPADRLRVLAEDDPPRRLLLLTELAEDAATVLAYRLSGG